MFIPNYFDFVSVSIVNSNGILVEYISEKYAMKKHIHTQDDIEKYILDRYEITFSLKSFRVYMKSDDENDIFTACFSIQLD